jgi:hypothetical protein
MKPNCYECKWRGDLPGSAHSCCGHPANHNLADNPLLEVLSIFASVGRIPPVDISNELGVKGNSHGINNGWFNWPLNFDPIWLEECKGFTPKSGGGEKSETEQNDPRRADPQVESVSQSDLQRDERNERPTT